MSLNYTNIAVSHVKFYLEKLEKALQNKNIINAKKERELMELELLEIYRAFYIENQNKKGLCGSFWDFITELQNTPGNYEKSLADLKNRS